MKEKILAELQTKFQGVDVAILSRIADKKAIGVTDESEIPTLVEGISFSDVLTSYGDYRAGDASFKAISNYEKKHKLKDGKLIEDTPSSQNQSEPSLDIVKLISEAVNTAVKPLSDKLSVYEQKELQAKRNAQIISKAKEYGIPETLVPMLKISDDADLDACLKDVKQTLSNVGFEGVQLPEVGNNMDKNSNEIADMINKGTEEIIKNKV